MTSKNLYIPSIKRLIKWFQLTKDWPIIIALKAGLIKKDINLRLRNGLKLRLINKGKDSDTTVLSEIYFLHPYTRKGFDIEEGDVVVDVGANVGIFSTYIANRRKNVKIYAYEPDQKNFNYLKKNIEQNNLQDKIKIFNLAVADKTGKVRLYLHDLGSGGHSLYKDLVSSKKNLSTEINSISLEDIFSKNKLSTIDFLKLDCEGAEYKILFSSPKRILEKIKKISIETHNLDGLSGEDIRKFLLKNGFDVKLKKDIVWALKKKV